MSNPIPLVSIVMPAHNHAAFVEAALRSVVAQTHPRIELIVIDDGSGDDTADVIARSLARLTRPMRVEFQRQPNRGLGTTLARALTLTRGDFVQFLASDDALFPQMTQRLVAAFAQAGPQVGAISCDGYLFDGLTGPHRPFSEMHPTPFGANQHRELMAGNWLPAMGLLYRRAALMQDGGIDPTLAYEDWGLLLALSRSYRIEQIPDRLFLYRQHGKNTSGDPERMRAALQALSARFPNMAGARDLRAAIGARDLRAILTRLTPSNLDLAARFMLRQIQRRRGLVRWRALRRSPARVVHSDAGRIEIGAGCRIHPEARLVPGPGALVLGAGCHIGAGVRLTAGAGLRIGAGSFIEEGAAIGGPEGQTGPHQTELGPTTLGPTSLGRACLIGAQSTISGASTLGDRCATMPGSQIAGVYPDECWLLPPLDGTIGLSLPKEDIF